MLPFDRTSNYAPAETLARIVFEGSRDKIIFLTFMTQHCPGCKETYDALHKFAKRQGGKVEIVVVDADRHPPIVNDYGVKGVPTIFVYGKQHHLLTKIGPQNERNLKKMLKESLAALPK
ncbi:MAG: thioredoxin family protein [Magnetococcales bacterium]|nr:thioredoxin family protein [Magnetococcales bacterium]